MHAKYHEVQSRHQYFAATGVRRAAADTTARRRSPPWPAHHAWWCFERLCDESPGVLWHNRIVPYWFDGNNLIGQSAAASARERVTLRAFLAILSEYARARRTRVTVYFDGDDRDRSRQPPGVEVRYCAPLSADDALLRDVRGRRSPGEIIVVTNDRDLGRRCRSEGAVSIAWEEFSARLGIARKRAAGSRDKEEHVRLEEWTAYFGLDKNSLE